MNRLLLLWLCLGSIESSALDWPIYRGPDHNGISRETDWSVDWPKSGPRVLWRVKVGIGFASFAMADGRVFTMGNKDGVDTVYCFGALSGKQLWAKSYESELGPELYEGGPGATPTVEGNYVYTISKWGDVFCFDVKSGKILWQRHLKSEEKMPVADWGFGGAPYPHGKQLLLNVGSAGMALDKKTGKTLWKSAMKEAGYSTPYPFRWQGQDWFIFSSGNSYSAVNPGNGESVWKATWYTRYGVNAADPIVAGNEVFVSSGYSKGAAKFKMQKGEPEQIWRLRKYRNQFNSSVLIDGHLYGFDGDNSSRAKLKCINWESGEELWQQDGIGFGSLMASDGKLIVLSAKGELMIAPASAKGFELIAKAKVLGGKCWTVPVLANGLIYCRNAAGNLVCLDVRSKK